MEYTQMTLNDWMGMKERLKKDLIGVQESFVRIGYTLRKIEDQELYKQDGYKTIADFAKAEYGLGSSTVSRFISINKKYSIDGYSDQLRPEFAQLGSSKLSEMLSLPDQDMEMIQPEATREGIRELKQFNRETPAAGVAEDIRELIEKFFELNKETLNDLYSSKAFASGETERIIEIVNPSGNKTFKKGLYFLMMYEKDIKIKKFGSDPQTMSWVEFFAITKDIFSYAAAGAKTWDRYFGQEMEEEMEVNEEPAPEDTREEKGEGESSEGNQEDREDDPETEGVERAESGEEDEESEEEGEQEEEEESGKNDAVEEGEGVSEQEELRQPEEEIETKQDMESEPWSEQRKECESKAIAPAQQAEILEKKVLEESQTDAMVEQKEAEPEEEDPASGRLYGSRKDYMDMLLESEMASYMVQEFARGSLTVDVLKSQQATEVWLLMEVDDNGLEIIET